MVKKLAAYVILAINLDGHKEVLNIEIEENESAKYWLGVLNASKNRGLKDILILCADGLTGFKNWTIVQSNFNLFYWTTIRELWTRIFWRFRQYCSHQCQ